MRITKGRLANRAIEETIASWVLHSYLSIIARSSRGIILSSSMMNEDRWVHIALTLVDKLFTLWVVILKAICIVLLLISSAAYLINVESISSFLLSSKINPISSTWITQLFPTPPSPFTYSKSWYSLVTQSFPLFQITWSRTPSTTRRCKIFSGKTALIWLATAL